MKSIQKIVITLLLAALMLSVFTACGTAVTVTIHDGTGTTKIDTKTGKTIAAVLQDAKISVGEKDETEPALDTKLKKEVTDITIKRYAKVTVVKENEKKEVELVGGTVAQAIEKAGFRLQKNESPDADPEAFLKDGMTITIGKAVAVTLVYDGKTETVTTKSASVGALLEEQKITLGKDDEISAKAADALKDGLKIVIKRIEYKTEKRTEAVPFDSTKENDSSLPAGQTKVKQQGANGEKEVTYKVKYADGKKESEEVVSEKVTKNAVNEIVLVGTGTTEPATQSGSGGKTIVSKTPTYDCDGSGHGYYTIIYSDGTTEYEQF